MQILKVTIKDMLHRLALDMIEFLVDLRDNLATVPSDGCRFLVRNLFL